MKTASIDEAQKALRELVEAARLGDSIDIVVDGEHVASLVPPSWVSRQHQESPERSTPESRLNERLAARGLMTINRHMPDPGAADELSDKYSGVLDALLEERDEGW
jgi:antitoxin (DNA-binding transcriptional repressor) of toxin-antitoxin stability system